MNSVFPGHFCHFDWQNHCDQLGENQAYGLNKYFVIEVKIGSYKLHWRIAVKNNYLIVFFSK